jgi:hypothetical protein
MTRLPHPTSGPAPRRSAIGPVGRPMQRTPTRRRARRTPGTHRRAAPAEHQDRHAAHTTPKSSVQGRRSLQSGWTPDAFDGTVIHGEHVLSMRSPRRPGSESPGPSPSPNPAFYVVDALLGDDAPGTITWRWVRQISADADRRRQRADILYVELEKDPRHYTPTTLYDDCFLSPTRFQWESQSKTRAESQTGRRYRGHASDGWKILLFVRQRADDERGFTSCRRSPPRAAG